MSNVVVTKNAKGAYFRISFLFVKLLEIILYKVRRLFRPISPDCAVLSLYFPSEEDFSLLKIQSTKNRWANAACMKTRRHWHQNPM